jgi:hypothetical protein
LVSYEIRTLIEVVYKHAVEEKIPTKWKGNNTELKLSYNMELLDFYFSLNTSRVIK